MTSTGVPWWDETRQCPDSWYRSPAGIAMAENILSWQCADGGWPAVDTVRERSGAGAAIRSALAGATVNEMRFLARGFRATEDDRYRDAVLRGFEFLLEAQYPFGGWPAVYPPRGDASDDMLFNGNLVPEVLKLLREIVRSPDFSFVGDDRERAAAAFDRGVQFILDTRTTLSGGRRAGWPGGTVEALGLLMRIDKPKPDIIDAIETAVAWLRETEPSAQEIFERYDAWQYARLWDAQPPTNIDEAQAGEYTLPDPLTNLAGDKVESAAQWPPRRAEILELFEQNQFGVIPQETIATRVEVVERDGAGLDGLSRRTQVRIHFPGHSNAPVVRVLLNVPADATAPVPTLLYLSFSPSILLVDEPGIDEGMVWSPALRARVPDRDAPRVGNFDPMPFIEAGFGVAMVYYGDIEPDFSDGRRYGVRTLFGAVDGKRRGDEWGAIGAWSWGLSRVMDYLETEPAVDSARVALSGASRLGKSTLWAAANDGRFAMAIPLIAGEGGDALSRRNYGETVADLTNPRRYDYWFAPNYAKYAFAVEQLPVDAHMLLSLIAPRPLLQIVGGTDTWSDPRGQWLAAVAAAPVYGLFGLSGIEGDDLPPIDEPLLGDMGFMVHDGGHAVLPVDYEAMTRFMAMHFGKG